MELNIVPNLTTDRRCKQTAYQANDYERSEVKAEQREKILTFILENHDDRKIKYFGMPGKYWLLERELFHNDPKSHICGIEKDFEIFSKSVGYLEGKRFLRRRILPWAHDKRTDNNNGIETARTDNFYYINGDLNAVTSDRALKHSRGRAFYDKRFLLHRSAIWLDFTSSFNIDTYTSIYNLHNIIHPNLPSVICLTLLYGRDQIFKGEGEQARVEIVEKALPGFNCKDVWIYKGFNDSSMINICGVLKPPSKLIDSNEGVIVD